MERTVKGDKAGHKGKIDQTVGFQQAFFFSFSLVLVWVWDAGEGLSTIQVEMFNKYLDIQVGVPNRNVDWMYKV